MRVLKAILRFLFSRGLWIFIGLAILSALIWLFGPLVSVGEVEPLASELVRGIVIGVIAVLWLFSLLLAQLRAARKNQLFVTELARPEEKAPAKPGEANIAEVSGRFQSVMAEMKRSKLGSKKFLRDMPWYLLIGPPGTGKTTALKQSGLHFPIDLSDDIKGVGGTRNCDWFFTEQAVLVDTAGRYVQQQSNPEVDAAEWAGFLEMLKKHRGRRALNGVIVALSMKELLGPEQELRAHGREIRKRLAELGERLQIHLPVYLMITKADLVPGFEPFFADLTTRDREQVWGATLATDARIDSVTVERETRALLGAVEQRLSARMAEDVPLPRRAEIFRFPAQMERAEGPLKILIDTIFGESRYEESPWLRGFYFTSATQEGSPIDRMLGEMAGSFGLQADPPPRRAHGETRSYFLRNLMTDVIFPEAGLGQFDRAAEERRKWVWRGSFAAAALAATMAGLMFLFSFLRYSGAIDDQERLTADLSGRLANVAARQAPTDPLDLDVALDAMTAVDAARTEVPQNLLTIAGPRADAELARAQTIAYERTLRNVLEPRMVALLEATMWRHIRDPEFMLGALKAYYMMTGLPDHPSGLAPYDTEFLAGWWQGTLPDQAVIPPFPTEAALVHQVAAIERLGTEQVKVPGDPELIAAALETVCTIPLSVRAYSALLSHPEVAALPEWTPAEAAGPNGLRVFTRVSGKTLRQGLPGAFTYAGFHDTVLPLIPEVAEQAALDRALFAGGCAESAQVSVDQLQADILKLYTDDFISQWDVLLRDIRLAPVKDLTTAAANLKDLSGPSSALKRLLEGVVKETDLTAVPADDGAEVPPGAVGKAASKLGKLGKLIKTGTKIAASSGGAAAGPPPGEDIARHFAGLKAIIAEVDGVPPLLTDTETAITALVDVLNTVASTPNPEASLAEQGGIATFTGRLVDVGATLPDPVDDWITGLTADIVAQAKGAVLDQLNSRWKSDILPFCRSATAGRFPFEPGSNIDVNTADFQRLFGPGGMFDKFFTETLSPHLASKTPPLAWRADFGLSDEALKPFEQAMKMRDALFPGGAGPIMAFNLLPTALSAGAARVTLNLDGQVLTYMNAQVPPLAMSWPGKDGTNLITLSFTPADGSPDVMTSESGSWAWLRLLRKGRLSPTDLPEKFKLGLAAGGHSASFDLIANSVDNPFDLTMFGNFRCPEGF
ncbi:MAG: type VI secretion system membrane subunit TssM [Rhodobacteraceae bacterium]|nr:type VI secretion system membrane subunit TssM [Paracoccaceae bacterium]